MTGWPAYLLRRAISALLLMLLVASATFVLVRLAGDPTAELVREGYSDAAIQAERARRGFDRPLPAQLASWLAGLASLDLGESAALRQPVGVLVIERGLATAALAALALALATIVGLPLGVLTGARSRGWLAGAVTLVSIALVSCPPVVLSLGLLLIAATTGWVAIGDGSIVAPTLALALPLAALLERLQSQATAEALASPDLAAAAARGVPPARLLWLHAGRQSLRPVLGVYGLIIGTLFSGSLVVEWVTQWPGLGRLTYLALTSRDLYLIAGCALAGAALVAAGQLAADLLRALADPRAREVA